MSRKSFPRPLLDFFSSLNFCEDWKEEEARSKGLSIYEDRDHVFVEASLPGIPSENIDISFENCRLSIKGEKKKIC